MEKRTTTRRTRKTKSQTAETVPVLEQPVTAESFQAPADQVTPPVAETVDELLLPPMPARVPADEKPKVLVYVAFNKAPKVQEGLAGHRWPIFDQEDTGRGPVNQDAIVKNFGLLVQDDVAQTTGTKVKTRNGDAEEVIPTVEWMDLAANKYAEWLKSRPANAAEAAEALSRASGILARVRYKTPQLDVTEEQSFLDLANKLMARNLGQNRNFRRVIDLAEEISRVRQKQRTKVIEHIQFYAKELGKTDEEIREMIRNYEHQAPKPWFRFDKLLELLNTVKDTWEAIRKQDQPHAGGHGHNRPTRKRFQTGSSLSQ